jgi:hypothetical protein
MTKYLKYKIVTAYLHINRAIVIVQNIEIFIMANSLKLVEWNTNENPYSNQSKQYNKQKQ